MGVLLMPAPKKSQNETDAVEGWMGMAADELAELRGPLKEAGYGKKIAVRDKFYEDIKLIAEQMGTYPGAVIEQRLRRFIKMMRPIAEKKAVEAIRRGDK